MERFILMNLFNFSHRILNEMYCDRSHHGKYLVSLVANRSGLLSHLKHDIFKALKSQGIPMTIYSINNDFKKEGLFWLILSDTPIFLTSVTNEGSSD